MTYIFLFAFGGLYWLLSINRVGYINSPDFNFDRRMKYLGWHVAASAGLGMVIVNVLIKKFFEMYYSYLITEGFLAHAIVGASIIVFLIFGEVINYNIRKTNTVIQSEIDVQKFEEKMEVDASFQSGELLDETSFWKFVNTLSAHRTSLLDYKKFLTKELESKSAKWIVEFNHRLIQQRGLFIEANLYPISQYIFRKYEEDLTIPLIEYLILRGKEAVNFVLSNPDVIGHMDFKVTFIKQGDLSSTLEEVFHRKTAKLLFQQIEFESSDWDSSLLNQDVLEKKFPAIYNKYK